MLARLPALVVCISFACTPDDGPLRSPSGAGSGMFVGSGSSSGGAGGSGASAGGAGGGGVGGAPVCPMEPAAPGGVCPIECTECVGSTCTIDCDQSPGLCNGDIVSCPANFTCLVRCTVGGACAGVQVNCSETRCDLDCAGDTACFAALLLCGAGPCELACSGVESCDGALVRCGAQACTASCDLAAGVVSLDCGPSCDCDGSTCGQ